jgi:ketosteroid isomerase-like protein
MTSIKLSVTIRKRLLAKYGRSGVKSIDAAIRAWSAANAAQGFKTVHVALDDAAALAKHGVRPLRGAVTAAKAKRVVDALFAALTPDYLVLIGSGDVVPFFEVVNPSARQDDEPTLLTDNPYGCSTKFAARNRRSYLVPDRVVGRIPDLPGADDPAPLVDYLLKAARWESRPAAAYRGAYAVCCDAWRRAGRDAMRKAPTP